MGLSNQIILPRPMPITPNEQLCAKCHKSTTDEWHASVHSQAGINCQACHNPAFTNPKAATVTELCANCHKERGSSFTHSTHANAGLECSNCHMYTSPRTTDPIQGLVPTGHTFFVGSDACIGCHQDTVHTRDQIMRLSGEVEQLAEVDVQTLEQTVINQQQEIIDLQAQSKVRLYTGLIQGAIVGLITGGVAAFIISRGIKVVEVEEEDNGEEKKAKAKLELSRRDILTIIAAGAGSVIAAQALHHWTAFPIFSIKTGKQLKVNRLKAADIQQ